MEKQGGDEASGSPNDIRHSGQKDSLLNPIRGQTREDGYATIEALAYLFQEMQAPKDVCDEFLRQLKVSIDHCRIQSGLDPVYERDYQPEVLLEMRKSGTNQLFRWDLPYIGPDGKNPDPDAESAEDREE